MSYSGLLGRMLRLCALKDAFLHVKVNRYDSFFIASVSYIGSGMIAFSMDSSARFRNSSRVYLFKFQLLKG